MITYENGERDVINASAAISEGIMTLDRRSGRLSINGKKIDKNSTHLYFTPEAEALYKSGDSISSVGDILIAVGAGGAAGYLVGSLIGGGVGNGVVYGVCGAFCLIGLPLHIAGVNKINSAIADYNSKHGFANLYPELSIGVQQHGIGLALNF